MSRGSLEPSIRLLSKKETENFLRRRSGARGHWTFIHNPGAANFLRDIERCCKQTNADYKLEVLVSPTGHLITFVDKHWLPARKLLPILKRYMSPTKSYWKGFTDDYQGIFVVCRGDEELSPYYECHQVPCLCRDQYILFTRVGGR